MQNLLEGQVTLMDQMELFKFSCTTLFSLKRRVFLLASKAAALVQYFSNCIVMNFNI